jgi:FOG: HEAT repeat
MKLKPAFKGVGLLILLTTVLSTSTLQAARGIPLRYSAASDITNAYKVQIELVDESGTNTLSGNLVLSASATDSNTITLSLRGNLIPKRVEMARRPMPMMGPSYPRWTSPIHLAEGVEIVIDERGKILCSVQDLPLPVPLGSVAQLLIPPLPGSNDKKWQSTEQLGILDDPYTLGPFRAYVGNPGMGVPYYGGFNPRQSLAILSGVRTSNFELESNDPNNPTIKIVSSFKTDLKSRSEARIRSSLTGKISLNRESGLLRDSELKFESTSETDTLTRRMNGTVSIRLLEGAERDGVLAAPIIAGNPPARKFTSAELQQLLNEAQSDDPEKVRKAATQFQSAELSESTPELMKLAENWAFDEDYTLKSAGARILATFATREQVPLLLKLLKQDNSGNRYQVLQALGRLKDPQAAQPIADLIARGADHYQAAEALAKLGPEAEQQALELLQQKHLQTLRSACTVLKTVGTEKSLEPLKALMIDPDQSLSSAASEAYRTIQARL